ncbi:YceI family protein [Zhouia sp. PK063]|uniref:YceI family protein n=1 Tax=Zhouia sp. PK063 TaxID=3373602 RepID=UPI0037B85B23
MKKLLSLVTVIAVAMLMVNCKNGPEKKNDATTANEEISASEQTEAPKVIDSLKLEWTGYKTTEKTPVKGVFKTVEIEGTNNSGKTPKEILDGATVTVPVSSLFSGNEARDPKLINIFFGTMENTAALKGVLHFNGDKTTLAVTMNNVTKEVPVETTFANENNAFFLEGDVQLSDFNASNAVEALAKACFELHKGADGVSKTWGEAHFKGTVYFARSISK